jgi:hypothetical protein
MIVLRPLRLAACSVLIICCGAGTAAVDESNVAPILGVSASLGTRGGWDGSDEPIAGGGLFGGARLGAVRLGALGRTSWWRANPGAAVDVGGFVSVDVASLWLDPQLSAAWFIKLEPTTFRWVSSTTLWAYTPTLELGVRLAGIEIGIAGATEMGLAELPDHASRIGYDAALRFGFDFVEIVRLGEHLGASSQPLAP